MKHEELTLEKQCRSHARACGWACWKNEKNGCKGIPDDSFLSPDDTCEWQMWHALQKKDKEQNEFLNITKQ